MRSKLIIFSFLFLMAVYALTGCGHDNEVKDADGIWNKSDEAAAIEEEMKLLTDAMDSKDPEKVYDMLDSDVKSDAVLDRLNDFEANYSGSQKSYVDNKSYWSKIGETGEITVVLGIIITDDNVYTIQFDFNVENNEITKLWIITGETESEENLNWADKYSFDDSEKFVYADYYDKGVTDYKLIWGKVVKWDESASIVDKEDGEKILTDTTTIDDVVDTFGQYGADVDQGYHFICYPSSKAEEYTQFFVDEEDVVTDVQTTDAVDYGIMGLVQVK